jgi:NADH-quinone oxidoreductase subunit L
MRLTGFTFIMGYLALAGIPIWDGFWSKDQILQSAWHLSPALWVVGTLTAGLTAYYMSRQVALVWRGEARWTAGHGGEPHESPWIMTAPLVILAVLSTFGWLINAPFGGLNFLDKWLAPVFPATIAPPIHVPTDTKWILGTVVTLVCFAGLGLGLTVWRRAERPALEPAFLAHGWYIDEGVAAVVSGPLARTASELSFGVDDRLVDGTVNAVARLAAQTGRQLRRLQTGYVRNYALGIGIGAAVILAFVALRAGS